VLSIDDCACRSIEGHENKRNQDDTGLRAVPDAKRNQPGSSNGHIRRLPQDAYYHMKAKNSTGYVRN